MIVTVESLNFVQRRAFRSMVVSSVGIVRTLLGRGRCAPVRSWHGNDRVPETGDPFFYRFDIR